MKDSSGVIYDNSANVTFNVMDEYNAGVSDVSAESWLYSNPNYYTITGQCLGTVRPRAAGIYIHQGCKVVVR